MTQIQFRGPGGKMPPDTAGKDARRYSSVAVVECPARLDNVEFFTNLLAMAADAD